MNLTFFLYLEYQGFDVKLPLFFIILYLGNIKIFIERRIL
ncbi:hypothetical protein IC006_2179 [Sulfuracidifex tepidarius]|uniref:Uncharacterized protein n=1 Tax=Sulfuracidifex tepidarius TaxID=1294262 RepID=A0A510E573_9CREN|nr:hypothetical protein IC006_2179 [Sulfuracidifex tepidarius]BBG27629.1 hypothetical protein IC007_2183 [Sulfuracidifex tepidarius]